MLGASMAMRAPRTRGLGPMAMDAIRRNNGTLLPPGAAAPIAGGGFTYGNPQIKNYLDSAMTTLLDTSTGIDQPVGGVVDSVGTRNATQATTASKPILRRTSGRYSWQFDGINDSFSTAITTGNEGWICAGVTPANTTTPMSVANAGEGTPTIPGVWLFSASGLWHASAANGSARHQANVPMAGTQPQVVSMGWNASGIFVGVNTTDSAITARTGDCSSAANTLRIGMYQGSTNPFNGPMTATVICPALPSAADRALIRRFIGSLQGQTL